MNGRFKLPRWLKVFLGLMAYVVILGGGIGLSFVTEKYVSEKIDVKQVVRTTRVLNPNEIIGEKDVELVSVKTKDATGNALDRTEDVIGKEVLYGLENKEQITKNKIDDLSVIPSKEGQYIFSIPDSWIANMPDTLRRKDRVTFWIIKNTKITTSANNTEPSADTNVELFIKDKPILTNVIVAYFRDGANNEVVTNTEKQRNGSERLSGTSVPKKFELLLTEDEFKLLKDTYEAGHLFVIGYRVNGERNGN